MAPPLPFFDFYIFMDRMHLVHHAAFFGPWSYPWMYPAPAAPLYAFLYLFCFGGNWFWGWLALALLTIGGCLFAIFKLARFRPASDILPFYFACLLLSWTIYNSLQRGNIESLLWLVLAAGIWQFARGHWTAAAVLIGVAGAFKIYPILCLALFIPRRKWKECALGLAVMAAVTIFSLWFINPDLRFAFQHVSAGVHLFTVMYARQTELGQGIFDHSAFELLKYVTRPSPAAVASLMNLYLVIAGCLMAVIFFTRILRMPLTNQVIFLIVAGVFLPPASFDYTLQNLYIPFAMVVLGVVSGSIRDSRLRYALLTIFAVELAPLTFIRIEGVIANGVVKSLGLLLLLIVAAWKPLPDFDCTEPTPSRLETLPVDQGILNVAPL